LLVVSSTASSDIGLFSRSKVPLTSDKQADKVTGVFTFTEMTDDSRRAALPMTAELNDTSPIGLAFDLSSKEKVHKPIPTYEEINESPTPLPALMVLNNEGVLASWWFIYSDSIRQGTIYSGLVAAGGVKPPSNSTTAPLQPATSAFGGPAKPSFGSSTFGAAPAAPAFGATSTPGAFGGPSALGQNKSVWGTPAATSGAFGSTATPATAFGTPSFGQTSTPSMGLGNKASPWATGSTAPQAAFGQSGGLAKPTTPFGTPTASSGQSASPGFAAFATKGGFAAAPSSGGSIFGSGSKPAESPFSKPSTGVFGSNNGTFGSGTSVFGSGSAAPSNAFSTPPATTGGIFGTSAPTDKTPSTLGGSFVLGSTFKADASAKKDEDKPTAEPKSSFFGGNFGGALNEAAKQPIPPDTKDDDMNDDEAKPEPPKAQSTTPASTPAAPKTQLFPSSTPATSGLFGLPSTSSGPPPGKPISTGFSFGQSPSVTPKPGGFFANLNTGSNPAGPKTPTAATPPAINPFAAKTPLSPKIKQEQTIETPTFTKIPEAPLPPDPTSKTIFSTGDSSNSSSMGADAPLPPDFIPKPSQKPELPLSLIPEKKPIPADLIPPSDVPGGPEDDGNSSEFLTEDEEDEQSEEGSGEDVAKDLSPVSEARPSPGFSPESSFGGPKTRSSESTVFGQMSKPGPLPQARSLFGEVGATAPILPPPKVQQSPRSPSPIRNAIPPRMSRPDALRSVSAPGAASQLLGAQRNGARPSATPLTSQNSYNISLEQRQAEEKRRAELKARREAEETRALDDEEDDRIHQFLSSDIEPTKILDEFEAYADRVYNEPMESIPAQVETVYRDINAMIDTLGLNARKMKAFIQGHTDLYKDEGRTRKDLEDDDEWCLVEIEDLSVIVEIELTRELESGRVKDVADKLDTCNSLQKDISRLRAKHEDVKKIVDAIRDPEQLATARAQPLSAEQSAQQNDLRREFTTFQKLLSEAEEGLTLLKANLVAHSASSSKTSGTGPTVEAVMRTITKMTSMAEKRSGDIDVLEGQMRRLRFGSVGSVGSREGSPFATPQKNNRASIRNPGSSSYGLFYTPDSVKETPQRFQNSVMSSMSPLGRSVSPRKRVSGYTPEEKFVLRTKLARKKEVTDKLKAALAKTGTRVRTMDEE
jgi:nucleoporin NUP159